MHPLDGANVKVDRARDHLKAIKDEIARVENERPYDIVYEDDVERGGYVIRYEFNPTRAARTPFFPILMADLVHNLRSALDQIAYGLAKPPTTSTAFPIWLHKTGHKGYSFMGRFGQKQIENMPAKAVEALERLQPYNRGIGPRDSLHVLHRLWIDDKHKFIPVASNYNFSFWMDVEAERPEDLVTQADLAPLPTDEPNVLVRVPATVKAKVKLHPKTTLRIRFDPSTSRQDAVERPYAGRPLVTLAGELHYFVRHAVLPAFDRNWF